MPTGVSIEIVRERTQTMGSDSARNCCVNVIARVRDVFLFSKVITWTPGVSGSLARTIIFLDASSVHCWADAMRVIAIELPPEDEVKDKDLVREFSRSRYVTAHNDRDETRDLYVVVI